MEHLLDDHEEGPIQHENSHKLCDKTRNPDGTHLPFSLNILPFFKCKVFPLRIRL